MKKGFGFENIYSKRQGTGWTGEKIEWYKPKEIQDK